MKIVIIGCLLVNDRWEERRRYIEYIQTIQVCLWDDWSHLKLAKQLKINNSEHISKHLQITVLVIADQHQKIQWKKKYQINSRSHLPVRNKMFDLTELSCVWLHSTKSKWRKCNIPLTFLLPIKPTASKILKWYYKLSSFQPKYTNYKAKYYNL